ncbi:hypothetical protein [Paraburkholderia guartelaensis]|uniref:hypothetical protein n=1 Tax=Paraburkholderia guartelaensis TaxID=2546446 RepID=UPI003CCC7031
MKTLLLSSTFSFPALIFLENYPVFGEVVVVPRRDYRFVLPAERDVYTDLILGRGRPQYATVLRQSRNHDVHRALLLPAPGVMPDGNVGRVAEVLRQMHPPAFLGEHMQDGVQPADWRRADGRATCLRAEERLDHHPFVASERLLDQTSLTASSFHR